MDSVWSCPQPTYKKIYGVFCAEWTVWFLFTSSFSLRFDIFLDPFLLQKDIFLLYCAPLDNQHNVYDDRRMLTNIRVAFRQKKLSPKTHELSG